MSPRNSGKLRSAAHRGQAEGVIGWIVLSVLSVLIILPLERSFTDRKSRIFWKYGKSRWNEPAL